MDISDLTKYGLIEKGEFTLKSGAKSKYYVNMKNAISFPEVMRKIINGLKRLIKDIDTKNTVICGVPTGAVPFASMLSYETGIPMIMIRKAAKEYGTEKLVEGAYTEGTNVILIEDVITTGNSTIQCAKNLEKEGLVIVKMLTVVSRYTGIFPDSATCDYRDIPIEYLIRVPQYSKTIIMNSILHRKGPLCVAADVTTTSELVELVEKIGPEISILKMHVDIITDFNDNTIFEIRRLKAKHNFIVWEDRKFADIGAVVKEQIHGGIYKISSWADLISMHVISGPDILKQAGDCHVIVITSMSSNKTLADEEYEKKCISMIEKQHDCKIFGIVTQNNVESFYSKFLKIVPGINISKKTTDNLGQKYSDIENKKWADVFVVGRDIVRNPDPHSKTIEYKEYIKKSI